MGLLHKLWPRGAGQAPASRAKAIADWIWQHGTEEEQKVYAQFLLLAWVELRASSNPAEPIAGKRAFALMAPADQQTFTRLVERVPRRFDLMLRS